jgi:uncharacterized protein (DUF427 family)
MAELPPEDVEDYPRPPRLERVSHRLRVELAGRTIADSTAGWRVLETHHAPTYYIPETDWADGVLKPAAHARATVCEWKGRARYYDIVVGDKVAVAAAWRYPAPTPGFTGIADCYAVYAGRMDACRVGDVAVLPQHGDFYGGWVTPKLAGRIKGAPGTEFW